jgi:simple sugar transport system ATP-binding protein
VSKASPKEIRKAGAALIPEDRILSGLVTEMNLEENIILGKHRERQFAIAGFALSWQKVAEFARALIAKFGIVVSGQKSSVKSLSGGNQQKVVVSREMSSEPEFILASQPTRGLDVASTEYMRKLLIEARNNGKAVLLISADLDEILQLSDRIAVMYEGRLIGIMSGSEVTKDRVGLLMGGIKE